MTRTQMLRTPSWRYNIQHLVQTARRAYHRGETDCIRFDVWNREEWDYVHQCMDACPNIPYFITRIAE